jgi:hypothetical protein
VAELERRRDEFLAELIPLVDKFSGTAAAVPETAAS